LPEDDRPGNNSDIRIHIKEERQYRQAAAGDPPCSKQVKREATANRDPIKEAALAG